MRFSRSTFSGRLAILAGALTAALLVALAADGAGRVAPTLAVQDLHGKRTHLSFKGKTSLVVYWATWCMPCRAEIPDLKRFQTRYAKRGFQIAAISVDQQGLAVVRPFARQMKLTYPVYLGNDTANSALGSFDGIPTSFLIDSRGRVVQQYTGLQDPRLLARDIERVLRSGGSKA